MKISKTAYYILSFTWGLPLTLIGCVVAGVLWCFGYRFHRWGYSYYTEIGHNWGGLDLGIFFFTDKEYDDHVRSHEFGHSVQNCLYGFLMIPLICIPSAIRYWYREMIYRKDVDKYYELPKYDAIWFEGQATKWGTELIEQINVGG